MGTLGILLLFGLAALVAAWVVNVLVGILSGERPRDTGRLWWDIFARMFAVAKFGVIGRVLNYAASEGWPLRVLYGLGVIAILLFLLRACHD